MGSERAFMRLCKSQNVDSWHHTSGSERAFMASIRRRHVCFAHGCMHACNTRTIFHGGPNTRGRQKRLMGCLQLPDTVLLELPRVAEDFALIAICEQPRVGQNHVAAITIRCTSLLMSLRLREHSRVEPVVLSRTTCARRPQLCKCGFSQSRQRVTTSSLRRPQKTLSSRWLPCEAGIACIGIAQTDSSSTCLRKRSRHVA